MNSLCVPAGGRVMTAEGQLCPSGCCGRNGSETSFLRVTRRSLEAPLGVTPMEPHVWPDPATRSRHDNDRTSTRKDPNMTTNADAEEIENPPRRPWPPVSGDRDVALQHSDRAGVLTPLLKSLGWELVGVGAQFLDGSDTRKPTGRMRSLFGRQVAAQPLVGSSPTASASCS